VIALHYLADLPVQAIASELGVPTGTVKSRLSRGREALAASLAHVEGGVDHV
jgi:RNA polymerase sigma-70 factor, ECF subfamily